MFTATNTIKVPLRCLVSYAARGVSPSYIESDGHIILNQKCIRENRISFGDSRLTDKMKKVSKEKFIQKYDVLVNSTGVGTLGRLAQFKKEPINILVDSHISILRPKDKYNDIKIDPMYFGYTLVEQENIIESLGRGATGQTELSKDVLLDTVKINLPEYSAQKKIAEVLSAYDDLIEVNQKKIKILEDIAQSIYKEWFVKPVNDFNFIKLGEKLNIKKGKNITRNTITVGNVPVVAGGLTPAYYHNQSNTLAPVVTISASGANAGFVNIYYENVWVSDCSFIDRNATDFPYFYYLFFKINQTEITRLQRGSAQPHVYPVDLASLEIADFPDDLIFRFEKEAEILFNQISNLEKQTKNLQKTRDILISQLVSGKVSLK